MKKKNTVEKDVKLQVIYPAIQIISYWKFKDLRANSVDPD